MKLVKNDKIMVTGGKDKGREGKIKQILPAQNKVLIEGINKYKKHIKPRGQNQPGQILDRERPLWVANIALVCPKCKQPTRVGYKLSDNKKVRICRKCKEEIS